MQHFPVTARGFSLIELLFAGALLSVFSFGVVQILAYSLEADRLGQEQSFATQYATEGIEATRSIRARDFDMLVVASESGLAVSEGEWTFSDSNNTDGKYTRVVAVEAVYRDESGNIIESTDGTEDPDTRKITTTVSWLVTPTRPNTVTLSTYLTRW